MTTTGSLRAALLGSLARHGLEGIVPIWSDDMDKHNFVYLSDTKCLYGNNCYVRDGSYVFRVEGDYLALVEPALATLLNALWNI